MVGLVWGWLVVLRAELHGTFAKLGSSQLHSHLVYHRTGQSDIWLVYHSFPVNKKVCTDTHNLRIPLHYGVLRFQLRWSELAVITFTHRANLLTRPLDLKQSETTESHNPQSRNCWKRMLQAVPVIRPDKVPEGTNPLLGDKSHFHFTFCHKGCLFISHPGDFVSSWSAPPPNCNRDGSWNSQT